MPFVTLFVIVVFMIGASVVVDWCADCARSVAGIFA